MPTASPTLAIRRATPDDEAAIIDLARLALGWDETGPHQALFRWKHLENPFGPSPMWVAETDGRMVGFRTFLRWEFQTPHRTPGRNVARAVRAVDTATHPDAQGQGVFTRLTRGALDDLRAEGVSWVFNTPNDKSRPGYLKMGWRTLGHVPIAVVPRGPRGLARMTTARQPAAKWSTTTDVGLAAADFFGDHDALARLLASLPVPPRLHTARTPAFLAWRYRFESLRYRCVPAGDRVEDGCVVVRLRSRGNAVEATVCDVLVPSPGSSRTRALLGSIPRLFGADYALSTTTNAPRRALPLPRQGPALTWRSVTDPTTPTLADLDLTLGDIELF